MRLSELTPPHGTLIEWARPSVRGHQDGESPGLHDERQCRTPRERNGERYEEPREPGGMRRKGPEYPHGQVAQALRLRKLLTDHEHEQYEPADDRDAEEKLEEGVGDELSQDDRPIRRREQRASLEQRLQAARGGHRSPLTIAGRSARSVQPLLLFALDGWPADQPMLS